MRIFSPFRQGDRVMVNSLYLGRPSTLDSPIIQARRAEIIGRRGTVAWVLGEGRVRVYLENVVGGAWMNEWELRRA